MESRAPWLVRGDPAYDPNRIGAITQAKVAAALVAAGKFVLMPFACVRPYDLAIDEDDGRLIRVQCKTGRLIKGAVMFRSHRLRAAKRETGWERRATNYVGAIEYFGVYCPETEAVYLVPVGIAGDRACSLRVTKPLNNQVKRIHWADDYLVRSLPL